MDENFLNKQFEELGVNTVFLFGSQAQGTANALSDFDFGILLENSMILDDIDARMKLYNKLYDIFSSQIKKFITIDIIFLDKACLQIQYQALKNSKILYNKNPQITINFKQKVLESYADFAPYRKEFNKLILERI
ncbi:MAG: nucleotidyltransferase domain-containing protein [Patescibacteria group bacterium]|nr:nucleotidyltransferase domain-containing protein [Patescibacteria group bacterium]